MSSTFDDEPREDEPAVPPGTDGDGERQVEDRPETPEPTTVPDPERELPAD